MRFLARISTTSTAVQEAKAIRSNLDGLIPIPSSAVERTTECCVESIPTNFFPSSQLTVTVPIVPSLYGALSNRVIIPWTIFFVFGGDLNSRASRCLHPSPPDKRLHILEGKCDWCFERPNEWRRAIVKSRGSRAHRLSFPEYRSEEHTSELQSPT